MKEDLLNAFDESGIDPQHTVVRCETQEEADIFLEYLHQKGVYGRKTIQELSRKWEGYGSETCYRFSKSGWCYARYYREDCLGISIVDFCDIYKGYRVIEPVDVTYSYDELFS